MDTRTWFDRATDGVLALVAALPADHLDRPGLGEWSVRELLAHTLRAWTTISDYLQAPIPDGVPMSAAHYFARGLAVPELQAGVAQRARADALALTAPAAQARAVADAARTAIAGLPDTRLVPSRFGPIELADYLRTRAFELTVHGLDLARATDVDPGPELVACAVPALTLTAEIAGARGLAVPLLLAATGRAPLPDGAGVMG